MRRAILLGVFAAVLVTAACATDGGAQAPPTIYVDGSSIGGQCQDGRSAAEASSPSTPVCTIARGVALAASGTTVLVRGGTYPATTIDGHGGTDYLTVQAYGGESVSLPSILLSGDASWLRFSGLHLTGDSSRATFRIEEGHAAHIQLLSSTVQSTTGDAVSIRSGASDILLQSNTISSRVGGTGGGNGISFSSTSGNPGSPGGSSPEPPITHVVIRGNRLVNIGTDAIRPANFDDVVIEGNEITGVIENGGHCDAIQVTWGGSNLVVRGNYIHDNQGQGIFIKDGRVTNATIENNLLVHNRRVGQQIQLTDVVGLHLVNNTEWDNDLHVSLRDGVRNAVVTNNIFERFSIDAESPTEEAAVRASTQLDYNLIASIQAARRGPHDTGGTPRFANPGAIEYGLLADSPGVDAGTAEGAPPFDRACRPRFDQPAVADRGTGAPPYVDLGALETGPQSTPADSTWLPSGACGSASPGPGAPAAPGTVQKKPTRVQALALRRMRMRGGRLVVTLVPRVGCRVRVSGRGTWRQAHRKRTARFHPVGKATKPQHRATVRLKVPHPMWRAYRHHRRLTLRLGFRLSGCGQQARAVSRTRQLRLKR